MAEEQETADTAPVEPVLDPVPAPDTPSVEPHDPLDDPITPAEQDAINRELDRRAKPIPTPPSDPPPPPPGPPARVGTQEPPSWMWWAAFALVVTGTVFAIVYTYRQGRRADEAAGGPDGSSRPS